MKKDRGYSNMTNAQVIGYVFLTLCYMVFIGFLINTVSPWWFLALMLWNWKWNDDNDYYN